MQMRGSDFTVGACVCCCAYQPHMSVVVSTRIVAVGPSSASALLPWRTDSEPLQLRITRLSAGALPPPQYTMSGYSLRLLYSVFLWILLRIRARAENVLLHLPAHKTGLTTHVAGHRGSLSEGRRRRVCSSIWEGRRQLALPL